MAIAIRSATVSSRLAGSPSRICRAVGQALDPFVQGGLGDVVHVLDRGFEADLFGGPGLAADVGG